MSPASTARAERYILGRLGAADTAVLSLHLSLRASLDWTDGQDADGCPVLLVGAHALRGTPAGDEYLAAVLAGLAAGEQIAGVHPIRYQPRASESLVEIIAGASAEVLCWGSRNSGKTQLAAGALLALAELHVRRDYALPLRALWLHASLVDASAKTARSLEEPLWLGLWQLRDDRRVAGAVLGGRELVVADFVGVQDVTTKERLRASAHVVIAEEAVGTLDEAGGIPEREYEVAVTSTLRLEGRRRVAIITTNPGSREHWCYLRFLEDGHDPQRVGRHVPSRDRLSEEAIAAQARPFRDAPDLEARLVYEQWTDLKLGPEVVVGFSRSRHVSAEPLWLAPGTPVWIGWDTAPASHVHAAVIAQRNGPQIRIFATFALANAGLKQLIDEKILPWFVRRAPWALGRERAREYLVHVLDPAALAVEGGDIDQSAERRIRASLGGGAIRQGQTLWTPRLGPLLAVMHPNSEVTVKFDPGPDCDLGVRACAGMWHYDMTRGGSIERDAPAKNERIFADVGDALCYVVGEMHPSRKPKPAGWKPKPARTHFDVNAWLRGGPR